MRKHTAPQRRVPCPKCRAIVKVTDTLVFSDEGRSKPDRWAGHCFNCGCDVQGDRLSRLRAIGPTNSATNER